MARKINLKQCACLPDELLLSGRHFFESPFPRSAKLEIGFKPLLMLVEVSTGTPIPRLKLSLGCQFRPAQI
jgi:hypothetical protein